MNYLLNEGYNSKLKVSSASGSILNIGKNKILDLSYCAGSLLLGHASKVYKDSLKNLIKLDIGNYATPNIHAENLSKILKSFFPHYYKFILCSSGSESIIKAIRIAKSLTQKNLFISVSGSWHGSVDQFLFSPNKNLQPKPISSGIGNEYKKNIKFIPYNDFITSKKILDKYKRKICAIIVEPVQGCLPLTNTKKYLKFLENFARKNNIILIFDEMITGIRTSGKSVQQIYKLKPSISTFGKCIGGGAPIGAIGITKKIFNLITKQKLKPYFGGTFSGNSISCYIGYQNLKYISKNKKKLFNDLNYKAQYIKKELEKFIKLKKINCRIYCFESIVRLVFTKKLLKNRLQRDFFEKNQLDNVKKFKEYLYKNKIYYPSNGIIFISEATTIANCNYIIEKFKKGLNKFFKISLKNNTEKNT
jgi:glutamate-1-semialdehyde 2,1-aminomutase